MAEKSSSDDTKKDSRKKTIKDIIEIVIFLGIAVLLVFSFNWILAAALKTDIPLVVVTSESMEPTYYGSNRASHGGTNDIRKDMLVVRGMEPSEIKVGDVIVFYRVLITNTSLLDYDREPIVHRVNAIYYNSSADVFWFTTKGDNPVTNDDYITSPDIGELTIHQDRVIGKIVGRIKYLGGLVSYFRTPRGRIVLIVCVAAIFAVTFLFGSFGKEENDEDIFDEADEAKKDTESEITFTKRLKNFFQKVMKHKHIVFPALILGIIIFIPIIDTLTADWGSSYGVTGVTPEGAEEFTLQNGNKLFIFVDVDLSCPGHWHQKFRSFEIQVINSTTGEILGGNNWTIVYNFEGTKTVNTGVWLDPTSVTIGLDYNMTVTANLASKFGRTWTDVYSIIFTLTMR
jgi:signal peptidase I